jgi:hypothetical protein
LRVIVFINVDVREICFISKVDFNLLVSIEIVFVGKRFLTVEVILVQVALIYDFAFFILK